jgi:hypothetical protein
MKKNIMRITQLLFLIMIFGALSNPIRSQAYSSAIGESKSSYLFFNSGFGYGTGGATFGLGLVCFSSNGWGGSLSYKLNIKKSKNVPSDYYDNGMRTIAPKDYLTLISLNFVKEFPSSNVARRFGIEIGPAWVKYNPAGFKLNPTYDPNNPPWFGNFYKYYKTRNPTQTIGLTLKGKEEFLLTRSCGLELAIFGNLNNAQSVFGIELNLNVGKIRK